jgi:hypothetical protein
MYLKEILWESQDLVHTAQYRNHWLAVVHTVPLNAGKFSKGEHLFASQEQLPSPSSYLVSLLG